MTINRLNRGGSLSRITGSISASASLQATGGNSIQTYAEDGKNWQAHIFNTTGPFSVNSIGAVIPSSITYNPSTDRRIGYHTLAGRVQYLLVAGGGGTAAAPQGGAREAGSGAGGMLVASSPVSVSSYTMSVGGGGSGGVSNQSNNGGNSTAFSAVAYGGGGGGYNDPAPLAPGNNGGSGGGAWYVAGPGGGFGLNPATPAPVIAGYPGYVPGTTQGYNGSPGFGLCYNY